MCESILVGDKLSLMLVQSLSFKGLLCIALLALRISLVYTVYTVYMLPYWLYMSVSLSSMVKERGLMRVLGDHITLGVFIFWVH
jgi:hypothetical protein